MRELALSSIDSKNLVAQANALIKARYKTTRHEEILLKSMMSLIQPSDQNFLILTATVSELAEMLGMDKKSAMREFDKITTRLLSRILKIENGEDDWAKFQWVSKASIKNGIVSLQFHDELKPYLLALRETGHFTQYRLEDVLWFKSAYTSRIYEMLIEANNKKQRFVHCTYFDFRERMLGEKSKSYPLFKNFRKYVLNVAQKELSQLDENGYHRSKLNFELITHRTGRKITDLEFRIIKQEKTQKVKVIDIDASPEEEPETDIQKKLLSYGISKANIKKFIAEHTEEYLLEKITYLKEATEKDPVKNTGAWLTKAIKEDWKGKSTASTEAEKKKADAGREKLLEERRTQAKEQQKKKRSSAEKQVKKEFVESLSDAEKAELLERLQADPENGHHVDKLDSGMARSMLSKYILGFESKVEALL